MFDIAQDAAKKLAIAKEALQEISELGIDLPGDANAVEAMKAATTLITKLRAMANIALEQIS